MPLCLVTILVTPIWDFVDLSQISAACGRLILRKSNCGDFPDLGISPAVLLKVLATGNARMVEGNSSGEERDPNTR